MIDVQRMAAGVLAAFAISAAAADDIARSLRFTQLGARSALELRGDGASATLDFGCRSDELVKRAVFRFRYVGSPALAPGVSHIRLALNGDPIATLPFAAATAGTLVEREVEVDPRLLVGFNKLVMTLIAAPGGVEDAARPGVWADVAAASELDLTLQPLTLADDLALLPEPFFDAHDQRRVTVPFAFGARPSVTTLRASAVVASWLGQHARWRGVRTPVALDTPTEGHSIAFAANDERPAFLAAVPPATGPALRLMTHPLDGRSKLLVVLGRNGEDLAVAANALVSGAPLSGASVQVKGVETQAPLAPYDAPAWVATDRAVRLGDLADWPQQLEVSGRLPNLEPARVELRTPPDLAAWRGPGIPMTLKIQYTPPACAADAYLEVGINDQLLETVPLRLANTPVVETKEVFIPYYRLRSRSELAFGFRFPVKDEPACRDARATVRAAILPESTIDFSGVPHFARMPNLAHFASVGFPFTRRADLSETVVVLPEAPARGDIEAMLELMARMGEATGRPATRVRVATPKDATALEGADLLVIGAPPQQALLARWSERMPVSFSGLVRVSQRPAARLEGVFDWLGLEAPPDTAVASKVSFEGGGPVAALYAFESPLTAGRSVVVATALAPDQLARVIDALDDRPMRRAIKGSAAFVLPDKVESVLVGPTYHVGFMPPWAGMGYWLSRHSEIVGIGLTLLLAALGYAAFVVRNRIVAWRRRRRT